MMDNTMIPSNAMPLNDLPRKAKCALLNNCPDAMTGLRLAATNKSFLDAYEPPRPCDHTIGLAADGRLNRYALFPSRHGGWAAVVKRNEDGWGDEAFAENQMVLIRLERGNMTPVSLPNSQDFFQGDRESPEPYEQSKEIKDVAFSPKGDAVAAFDDRHVQVWRLYQMQGAWRARQVFKEYSVPHLKENITRGMFPYREPSCESNVHGSVDFSDDGAHLLAAGGYTGMQVWRIKLGHWIGGTISPLWGDFLPSSPLKGLSESDLRRRAAPQLALAGEPARVDTHFHCRMATGGPLELHLADGSVCVGAYDVRRGGSPVPATSPGVRHHTYASAGNQQLLRVKVRNFLTTMGRGGEGGASCIMPSEGCALVLWRRDLSQPLCLTSISLCAPPQHSG